MLNLIGEMVNSVEILHITDLHFNHPKVSTQRLVENYTKALLTYPTKSTLRTLVLSGDYFDRPTNMDTPAGKDILYSMNYTIEWCGVNDVALVVVKGTGNHDGRQTDSFVKLNSARQNPIDLTYVDSIMTWVDRDSLLWLGVPDEASPSAEQTKAEIQKLMKSNNITKFDIGTTHGYYDFHAGAEFNPLVAHDSRWYRSIVNYIIFNGHIHTRSFRRGVLTGGSFDRNRHGEEEAKGMHKVVIDTDSGDVRTVFLENTNASTFETYKLVSDDVVAVTKELDKYIQANYYEGFSWLRISHKKSIDMTEVLRILKERYASLVEITTKKIDDGEVSSWASGNLARRLLQTAVDFTPILPTTIIELMEDKLKRMGVDDIPKHISVFKEFI